MIIVIASTRWRPILSPSGPKTIPPTGRTRNAAANVPKVAINCADGLLDGKNTFPSTTAIYGVAERHRADGTFQQGMVDYRDIAQREMRRRFASGVALVREAQLSHS